MNFYEEKAKKFQFMETMMLLLQEVEQLAFLLRLLLRGQEQRRWLLSGWIALEA